MGGTANLILITLLLLLAQRSDMLVGYEAYAWALMLWLGVANAALLSNHDSRVFRFQELLKLVVLAALAAQLSPTPALMMATLALMATIWQWYERDEEVTGATS